MMTDPHIRAFADLIHDITPKLGGELSAATVENKKGQKDEVPAMQFETDGRRINLVLFDVPGDLDHFSVIVAAKPQFTLGMRRESRFDWLKKSLHAVQDIQVGFPDFDDHYLISGKPTDAVVSFLLHPDVRDKIEALGEILDLSTDAEYLRASFPLTPKTKYTEEILRRQFKALVRLAETSEESPDEFR